MLQCHLRHRPVHESKQRLLDDDIETHLFLADDLDLGGNRGDHRIGEEYARECPHQRGADECAQNLGCLVEGTHRLDDPEHRGNDAERRQGLGYGHHGVI